MPNKNNFIEQMIAAGEMAETMEAKMQKTIKEAERQGCKVTRKFDEVIIEMPEGMSMEEYAQRCLL